MNECLQKTNGPTPCFAEAGVNFGNGLPCGLNRCEASDAVNKHGITKWEALHKYCPITHPFDYKGKNRSIQLGLIANSKK